MTRFGRRSPDYAAKVREAELAGVRRMHDVLRTGKWPTGLPITSNDREVIAHNIALVERRYVRA